MQDFRNKSDEELAAIAQSGGEGAEEELLNRYKSAVRARARKFFLTGGETEDLAQEGMIGLVSAIRDFRADGGKSFKNFAYLCVSRRIYSALRAAAERPNMTISILTVSPREQRPRTSCLQGRALQSFAPS